MAVIQGIIAVLMESRIARAGVAWRDLHQQFGK
jgi:hypothetical protein